MGLRQALCIYAMDVQLRVFVGFPNSVSRGVSDPSLVLGTLSLLLGC